MKICVFFSRLGALQMRWVRSRLRCFKRVILEFVIPLLPPGLQPSKLTLQKYKEHKTVSEILGTLNFSSGQVRRYITLALKLASFEPGLNSAPFNTLILLKLANVEVRKILILRGRAKL
jgi:hypothetical protein